VALRVPFDRRLAHARFDARLERDAHFAPAPRPVFLIPVLFVSSAFFSWLAESRNFMPVVIVLAVATGYLLTHWAATTGGAAEAIPPPGH
jgi:hypothetical protein